MGELASVPGGVPGCLPFTRGPGGTAETGEMKREQVAVCRLNEELEFPPIDPRKAQQTKAARPSELLVALNGLQANKQKGKFHGTVLV